MSGKVRFPGLLALASLAMAIGCERALPPDPPANLEKAQEIRAGLIGEEEASDEDASAWRPAVDSLAVWFREAPFCEASFANCFSTGPHPRLQS